MCFRSRMGQARLLRTILLFAAIFSAMSLASSRALAWGEERDLSTKWRRTFLEYPVLRHHRINYCVSIKLAKDKNGKLINPGDFSARSIGEQTKMALQLWLTAVSRNSLNGPVIINQFPTCYSKNINLIISIGPSNRHWALTMGEYNTSGYYLSHVYINTNSIHSFYWNSQALHVPTYDFQYLLHSYLPGWSLKGFMKYANTEKMDVNSIGKIANAPAAYFGFSSYAVLLHEIGHAFGLCDTINNPRDYDCDPRHVSVANPADQPPSVMRDADYYYLTSDDRAGVRDAFHRFSYLIRNKIDFASALPQYRRRLYHFGTTLPTFL